MIVRPLHLFTLSVSFLFGACVWAGSETPPSWVLSPKQMYPNEQFLTGVAKASDRDQAEKHAYAAVARIFSAKVQAQSTDRESYRLRQSTGLEREERTLHLDQRTRVTTNKVLRNVKILDVWYQASTKEFHAIAGLNRQQAEQDIRERLRNQDDAINALVQQARAHPRKLQRMRAYKHAIATLTERELLNADLRIIRVSGQRSLPPYRIGAIQQEFQDFVASNVAIAISITGTHAQEIERAIQKRLEEEGLLGMPAEALETDSTNVDLAINGQTHLWTVDLPDPLFKYVRWCGDIDIYEYPSRRLVGVVSTTGREGHITEQEAAVRAGGVMQQRLSDEVVTKLTHSIFKKEPAESLDAQRSKACP